MLNHSASFINPIQHSLSRSVLSCTDLSSLCYKETDSKSRVRGRKMPARLMTQYHFLHLCCPGMRAAVVRDECQVSRGEGKTAHTLSLSLLFSETGVCLKMNTIPPEKNIISFLALLLWTSRNCSQVFIYHTRSL